MIKLRYDSRDKHYYQHFGQIATTDFPESLDFDTAQYDDIQPIGDVKCTCYTACDIAEDQKNRVFDIDDLWKRIPSSRDGADPRDVFKEVINNGLLPTGQSVRAKDWKSFWSALSGSMDYFDNVRSAIFKSQSPVSGAIFWCSEYSNSTQMVEYKGKLAYILPMGKTYKGGHMFSIEGWITVNGEPMLIIEAWVGKKLLMPRDVFNLAMNKYGACSFVLSTSEMDEKIRLNILEKIKDACINVILLMKQLLVEKKVDNPLPPEPQQVYNEVKEELMISPLSQKVYDTAYSLLGKYLTMDSSVPKNLNCAQAVSYVLNKAGLPIPKGGISGTIMLNEWLKKHCNVVTDISVGDIIISITQGEDHGHVGVMGKNSIMSNNSPTGLFTPNYSLKDWIKFYVNTKKLKTIYYRFK